MTLDSTPHSPTLVAEPEVDRIALTIPGRTGSDGPQRIGRTVLVPCEADERSYGRAVRAHWPQWVVLGARLDDDVRRTLVQVGKLIRGDLLVAVIASDGDLAACERWLRRGCSAYLSDTASAERLCGILDFVSETGVVTVDRCFQENTVRRQVGPVRDLTRREGEVLARLQQGFRNTEIAADLSVSASTVDFHVRNVLAKLGARNRVEAVRRARALGL